MSAAELFVEHVSDMVEFGPVISDWGEFVSMDILIAQEEMIFLTSVNELHVGLRERAIRPCHVLPHEVCAFFWDCTFC